MDCFEKALIAAVISFFLGGFSLQLLFSSVDLANAEASCADYDGPTKFEGGNCYLYDNGEWVKMKFIVDRRWEQ